MSKVSDLYVFVILIWQLCGSCEGIKISDFHDFCGNTIYNEAGELQFDAQKLPPYLSKNKCSVSVQPLSKLLTETTQVMFYFTKFDLSGSCEDMNVTILDGSLFGARLHVEGLPEYLCGHNASLENSDQVFTTSSDQFTVTFSRKDFARHSLGNFSIKFIAFQTGECNSNGVFRCSTGRCIADEYSCSEDINACGEHQLQCGYLETYQHLVDEVLSVIQKYSWIVIVIIGLCVLKFIYKRNQKTISDLTESVCLRLRNIFSASPGSTRRSDTSRRSSEHSNFVQLQSVDSQHARGHILDTSEDSSDLDTWLLYVQSRENSLNEDHHIPNSAGGHITSSDTQQNTQLPSAPPPSYDEVVGTSN